MTVEANGISLLLLDGLLFLGLDFCLVRRKGLDQELAGSGGFLH